MARSPRQGRGEGRRWAARSPWILPAPLPSLLRPKEAAPWAARSQELRRRGTASVRRGFPKQGSLFLPALGPFGSGEKQGSKISLLIMKSAAKKKPNKKIEVSLPKDRAHSLIPTGCNPNLK